MILHGVVGLQHICPNHWYRCVLSLISVCLHTDILICKRLHRFHRSLHHLVVSLLEAWLAHPVLLETLAASSRHQCVTLAHRHPVCVSRTLDTGVAGVFACSKNVPLGQRHLHVLGLSQYCTEGVLVAVALLDGAPLYTHCWCCMLVESDCLLL